MSDDEGAAGSSSEQKPLRNIYVLYADNDEKITQTHQTLMEESPFEMDVETVNNGNEVVSTFLEGETYDLVFLDQKLPIKNGAEVAKTLREMKVKSYIVGLYDPEDEDDEDELNAFIKAGLDACIKKPLTQEKIELILRKTIDKGSKD